MFVEISRHAADAVAAHFGLAAVGIDDAHARVAGGRVADQEQAVGAERLDPIADPHREAGRIGERRKPLVDEHEVVAAPVHLDHRDAVVHVAATSLSSGIKGAETAPCGEIVETACL